MLEKIHVNGFRSLHGFRLTLRPGLNVLLGPNGSGKTNVVAFFDFVSSMASRGLLAAISDAGGATRVFSYETSSKEKKIFSFELEGEALELMIAEKSNSYFSYKYSATIEYDTASAQLLISREEIAFSNLYTRGKRGNILKGEDNILRHSIAVSRTVESISPNVKVIIDHKISKEMGRFIVPNYFVRAKPESELLPSKLELNLKKLIEDFLSREPPYASVLRLSQIGFIGLFISCSFDISSARSINVDPSEARKANDLTQAPTLSQQGGGLSSVLFHLSNATESQHPIGFSWRIGPPKASSASIIGKIENSLTLINSSLQKIKAELNTDDGTYRVWFDVIGSMGSVMPLSIAALSDGTVKFLTLITALFYQRNLSIIEEPENFLHFDMQRQFVDLVREATASDVYWGRKWFLISTHSETLINRCKPSEIILCAYRDGATVAERPESDSNIEREVRKRGIGLGYLYTSGALQ